MFNFSQPGQTAVHKHSFSKPMNRHNRRNSKLLLMNHGTKFKVIGFDAGCRGSNGPKMGGIHAKAHSLAGSGSLRADTDWHKNHAVLAQTDRVIPETIPHTTPQSRAGACIRVVFILDE